MFQDVKAVLPPFSLIFLGGLLGALVHPSLFTLCLFGLLDTHGRYNDYWYLMGEYFDPKSGECNIPRRTADYYGKSFCGRWLVKTCDSYYRETSYYHSKGYRWWHVLPDGFPRVLLNRNFWRNLLKGHEK